MSTHEVKVIRIEEIFPHENADKLEIVKVWGYTCAIRKDSFKVGDLAAFVEPDYEVPLDKPEFSFLSKPSHPNRTKQRISVSRLRGVYSQGLLVPAPIGSKEGDNVMELLGITRYEPQEEILVQGAFAEKGPEFFVPHFDLENWKKYSKFLVEGEEVLITGKIHGCQGKYLFWNDRMWCGSRKQWKKAPGEIQTDGQAVPQSAWWLALEQNPFIEKWCRENTGCILYGEVYGQIQKGFPYGMTPGQLGFAVFDILENGEWTNNFNFSQERYNDIQFVENLYQGHYSSDVVERLAELPETFNGCSHIREGVVIKVKNERTNYEIGRVALKHVSNQYLSQK